MFDSLAEFKTATSATSTPLGNGFETLSATFILPPDHPYAIQRITVENVTLDLRWSGDALTNRAAVITNIIARPNDRFRVLRNVFTYGVVSLFGFGIGVYDLNAMESNDSGQPPPGCEPPFCRPRELVRTTSGSLTSGERFAIHEDPNDPTSPLVGSINPCNLPNPNLTPAIPDLTFTADAGILTSGGSSALRVFALDPGRGILDLIVHPPTKQQAAGAADDYTCGRSPYGLVFRNRYQPPNSPLITHDHPRLAKLRQAFMTLRSDPPPFGRFTGLVHYHWRLEAQDNKAIAPPLKKGDPAPGQRGSYAGQSVDRDYLLVAGNEYGLMVVEVDGTPPVNMPPWYMPLQDPHLVDIIWIPTGAYAVRHIPRTNLAVVVDREGHVILVDLSRLDERFKDDGTPRPDDELFPSVAKALSRAGTWGPPATAVGMPDPRIVWRSEQPYVEGTLPPVIDGDTGILYAGAMLKPTTMIGAVIDPRIQVKVDVGAPAGLVEVGGIVPLGVDPPREIQLNQPNGSLGAFRLELTLPGAITESLSTAGNRIRLAVESERVFGSPQPQTPEPFPRSHLRVQRRDGTSDPRPANDFYLERAIPPSLAAQLRHQRGFNKFISPWIVAIADPRASIGYVWPPSANKAQEGCYSCDRPQHLQGKKESDGVYEL